MKNSNKKLIGQLLVVSAIVVGIVYVAKNTKPKKSGDVLTPEGEESNFAGIQAGHVYDPHTRLPSKYGVRAGSIRGGEVETESYSYATGKCPRGCYMGTRGCFCPDTLPVRVMA